MCVCVCARIVSCGLLATVKSFIIFSKRRVYFVRKGSTWSRSSSLSSTPASPPSPSPAGLSSPSSALPRKTTKRSGILARIHRASLSDPQNRVLVFISYWTAATRAFQVGKKKKKKTEPNSVFPQRIQVKCRVQQPSACVLFNAHLKVGYQKVQRPLSTLQTFKFHTATENTLLQI